MKIVKRQNILNKCLKTNTDTHIWSTGICRDVCGHVLVDIYVCLPVLISILTSTLGNGGNSRGIFQNKIYIESSLSYGRTQKDEFLHGIIFWIWEKKSSFCTTLDWEKFVETGFLWATRWLVNIRPGGRAEQEAWKRHKTVPLWEWPFTPCTFQNS